MRNCSILMHGYQTTANGCNPYYMELSKLSLNYWMRQCQRHFDFQFIMRIAHAQLTIVTRPQTSCLRHHVSTRQNADMPSASRQRQSLRSSQSKSQSKSISHPLLNLLRNRLCVIQSLNDLIPSSPFCCEGAERKAKVTPAYKTGCAVTSCAPSPVRTPYGRLRCGFGCVSCLSCLFHALNAPSPQKFGERRRYQILITTRENHEQPINSTADQQQHRGRCPHPELVRCFSNPTPRTNHDTTRNTHASSDSASRPHQIHRFRTTPSNRGALPRRREAVFLRQDG